jgi:hypothetical protein
MKNIGYIASPNAIETGTVLTDATLKVSLKPEDALRYDGLWPDGQVSKIYELRTTHAPEPADAQMTAAEWVATGEVPAGPPMEKLSGLFVDFESKMLEEQLLWRQAYTAGKVDVGEIEEALKEAIAARGLRHWTLVRSPSAEVLRRAAVDPQGLFSWSGAATKLAWDAWELEADEDEVLDLARRAAWTSWYHPVMFDSDAAFAAHENVHPRAWDAWAALVTYYTASQGWIDTEPERLTVGVREAYQNGLALLKPTGRGILQWAI